MAKYKSADIRNIVLCGHSGSGKTMLAEAMLFKAKAVTRLGSVDDGTTVSDYEQEEKERKHSLAASILHCTYDSREFRIIDTPGGTDFIGGMVSGLEGADLAVICVNASKGVELMARKAWDYAGDMGLGRMVAITRMDGENVNYEELVANIQSVFGAKCVPFTIPDGEGATFKGVTRVMAEDAHGEEVDRRKQVITENAVECDDTLMERYLEGGEVTHDEVLDVMQRAICDGSIIPVFALAAEKDIGVEDIMHGIAEWGTTPLMAKRKGYLKGEEADLVVSEDGPLCAQVFKIVSDPHVGKLSYFRIFSGSIKAKDSAYGSTNDKQEKFTQIAIPQGEKRDDVDDAIAGDIVAVAKIESLHVGTTVYGKGCDFRLKDIPFPTPMTGLAITAKSRNDEQKIGINLNRLCEEDPTFIFERNEMTGEQVIRGIAQTHLDVMLSRLKHRFHLEVNT
ncbi:MAG: GTP-binding protein, partial [Planctomycetes bacterium]|nr:GTP-binding protein [Planctomycetota bacterium]